METNAVSFDNLLQRVLNNGANLLCSRPMFSKTLQLETIHNHEMPLKVTHSSVSSVSANRLAHVFKEGVSHYFYKRSDEMLQLLTVLKYSNSSYIFTYMCWMITQHHMESLVLHELENRTYFFSELKEILSTNIPSVRDLPWVRWTYYIPEKSLCRVTYK